MQLHSYCELDNLRMCINIIQTQESMMFIFWVSSRTF